MKPSRITINSAFFLATFPIWVNIYATKLSTAILSFCRKSKTIKLIQDYANIEAIINGGKLFFFCYQTQSDLIASGVLWLCPSIFTQQKEKKFFITNVDLIKNKIDKVLDEVAHVLWRYEKSFALTWKSFHKCLSIWKAVGICSNAKIYKRNDK